MKMTLTIKTVSTARQQSGVALAVALLLLTLLTILAMSASHTTRLEERMAGNARDLDIAFQAAEAGLRDAENYIATLPDAPSDCPSAPCKIYGSGFLPIDMSNLSAAWWTTYGWEYGTSGKEMTMAIADPRYVIEQIGFVPDSPTTTEPPTGRYFFRIFSSAIGATDAAKIVLETTYARRLDSATSHSVPGDSGRQSWRQIR